MVLLESVIGIAMVVHLVLCPYTKVEESFNLQAMHDILYCANISEYDHLEFPGVVPRTFLGPLMVSAMATPYIGLMKYIGLVKVFGQIAVRCCLGVCVLFSFLRYKSAVSDKLGRQTASWLLLITASQFHFMFYMSRPLPNTFALAAALVALSSWLWHQEARFIWASACAILLFRVELAGLLALMLLMELTSGRLTILRLLKHAVPAGTMWLVLTILVDSFFWRRWLWPEGEVLWFNTVLNKSSQWGTSPYAWYFYSAIPRALGTTVLLVPLGLVLDRRSRTLLAPSLGFLLIYSILPHKELRFIIYIFPLCNTVAAMACSTLWNNRRKSIFRGLLALMTIGHLAANVVATGAFLYISHLNYPGGVAMDILHQVEPQYEDVHVHIDVPCAQTGVSRFTQLYPHWEYNKTEGLTPGGYDLNHFTHLLLGVESGELLREYDPYRDTHEILATVHGYVRLKLWWPPRVLTAPRVLLLKKI